VTYCIAEAGVNHNGSLEMAKQLIDVAADAGADAVKFQTFRANEVVSKNTPKAEYQIKTTAQNESQLEMIRKLELNEEEHKVLILHSEKKNIEFLSTPFDLSSLKFLTESLGLETIKYPSGEITNAPFLLEVARSSKQIILSTGMSSLDEIEAALGVIAFGFTSSKIVIPKPGDFKDAFASKYGQNQLRSRITLLHCTSAYPAPFNEVNLLAMDSMANEFNLPVGYSDHTKEIHISLAAVARGAKIIEKHFTLDHNLPGPDQKASLEPNELRQMVRQIRDIENALGDGVKRPTSSELKNINVSRRSLVAENKINKGDVFTNKNVTYKRPGEGVSPYKFWEMLGRRATRNYNADELLDEVEDD